jgi:hypothetical protein
MLLESQHDFEATGPGGDLSRYRTVILPGGRCLDAAAAEKLRSYLAAGGTVLALHESALGVGEDRFVLPVGAEYVGPGTFECDYLVVGPEIGAGLVSSPILHNHPALRVRTQGARVLARIREPYFNRTYGHYVSHQNAPHTPAVAAHPGALRNDGVVYLPHPLGRIYLEHGARVHRDLFLNALHLLYSRPTLEVRLPSAGRVNLLHQPEKGRYVVHLLYAPPLLRGTCLVIDDLPPLLDVPVRLRVPHAITRAYLVPQGTELAVARTAGAPAEADAVSVVVPRVEAHQAVVFEYGDT